jgi:hypothetical protein
LVLFSTNVMANETKTYTPKETLEAFSKVPGKIVNHFSNEKADIIAYQTKVWSDQKVKNAQMWAKLKSLFKGKNDTQD